MTHFESVKEFMELMGQDVLTELKLPTTKLANLRHELIKEEIGELGEAFDEDDLVEIADALADILYVTYGAYAAFGLEPGTIQYKDEESLYSKPRIPCVTKVISYMHRLDRHLTKITCGYIAGDFTTEVRCALDDINDIAYQIAYENGINLNACFSEVHDSNMSKACLTESDAIASLKMRKEDPETAKKYIDAEVVQIGERFVLKRKSDGKILKGQHYFEPNLKQYL